MADVQIKTITDAFAYMLIYVAGCDGELSEESANEIILNARAHWFDDDEMDTEKSEDTSEDS